MLPIGGNVTPRDGACAKDISAHQGYLSEPDERRFGMIALVARERADRPRGRGARYSDNGSQRVWSKTTIFRNKATASFKRLNRAERTTRGFRSVQVRQRGLLRRSVDACRDMAKPLEGAAAN
jgi:hypothetical protein